MNEMPNYPTSNDCHCFSDKEMAANCACGESEKALRGWISGRIKEPMTPEQREWCYTEIENIEAHDRENYLKGTDAEVARGVLDAWMDFCQDKGLM